MFPTTVVYSHQTSHVSHGHDEPSSQFLDSPLAGAAAVGASFLGVLCPWMAEKRATSPVSAIENIMTPAIPAVILQFRWRHPLLAMVRCLTNLVGFLCGVSLWSTWFSDSLRSASLHSRAGPAAPPSKGEPSLSLPTIATLACPGCERHNYCPRLLSHSILPHNRHFYTRQAHITLFLRIPAVKECKGMFY